MVAKPTAGKRGNSTAAAVTLEGVVPRGQEIPSLRNWVRAGATHQNTHSHNELETTQQTGFFFRPGRPSGYFAYVAGTRPVSDSAKAYN